MGKMKKKKEEPKIRYFRDDQPSSLMDIIEHNPDSKVWKTFLEDKNLQKSDSAKKYLKYKIDDYLSAREISKRTGISTRILDKWRQKGNLKAETLKGRWYYSLSSVVECIRSADIDDLR